MRLAYNGKNAPGHLISTIYLIKMKCIGKSLVQCPWSENKIDSDNLTRTSTRHA